MRVPLDVFGLICEYLPNEVVFNLWNTGRELHDKIKFRKIYIGKILPFLRMATMSKLDIYLKNCRPFYVEIDDSGILKSFGIMECKWSLKEKIFIMSFTCGQLIINSPSNGNSIKLDMYWSIGEHQFVLEKVEYFKYCLVFPLLKLTIKKV